MPTDISNNPTGLQPITMDQAIGQVSNFLESNKGQPVKEEEVQKPEQGQEVIEETGETQEEETQEEEVSNEEETQEASEGEEPEEENATSSNVYKLTVDGEETEVSLDELTAGYSRQSDYTRKTTELAKERKAFENEKQTLQDEVLALREAAVTNNPEIAAVQAQIKELENTDWVALAEKDAELFSKSKMKLEALKLNLSAKESGQKEEQKKLTAEREKRIKVYAESQAKALADASPELASDTKRIESLHDFAQTLGFSKQEVEGALDHRIVILLNQAKQYQELKEGTVAKKAKVNKAKVVKSKASKATPKGDDANINNARKRLQSGDKNAATDFVAGLLSKQMNKKK